MQKFQLNIWADISAKLLSPLLVRSVSQAPLCHKDYFWSQISAAWTFVKSFARLDIGRYIFGDYEYSMGTRGSLQKCAMQAIHVPTAHHMVAWGSLQEKNPPHLFVVGSWNLTYTWTVFFCNGPHVPNEYRSQLTQIFYSIYLLVVYMRIHYAKYYPNLKVHDIAWYHLPLNGGVPEAPLTPPGPGCIILASNNCISPVIYLKSRAKS